MSALCKATVHDLYVRDKRLGPILYAAGGRVCQGGGSRMDENLDGGPRSDRRPQHRTIEEGLSGRHRRPSEKEHERLPRHAGVDSAERLSLGAVSATLCHPARSDRPAQAPYPGQTGAEAATDSGEKESHCVWSGPCWTMLDCRPPQPLPPPRTLLGMARGVMSWTDCPVPL